MSMQCGFLDDTHLSKEGRYPVTYVLGSDFDVLRGNNLTSVSASVGPRLLTIILILRRKITTVVASLLARK